MNYPTLPYVIDRYNFFTRVTDAIINRHDKFIKFI